MALWVGVLLRQRISGSNSSTTLCALTITGGAGYRWLCCSGPKALVTVGVLTDGEQQKLEEALNVLLEDGGLIRSRSSKAMRKIFIAG